MVNTTKLLALNVALAISFLTTSHGYAQSFINEVRIGGSIIDVTFENERPIYGYRRKGINAEALTAPVNIDFFEWGTNSNNTVINALFNPRIHFGATIALEKNTTSSAYTGLTWHLPFLERLFLEGSFGAAIHNGEMENVLLNGNANIDNNAPQLRGYGSPVLFRESIAVGAKITENVNVILQMSHMSHAGLAGEFNSGQSDVALKLGWQF